MSNGKGRNECDESALDLEYKYLVLAIAAMLPTDKMAALHVLEDTSTMVEHYLHRREPMRIPVLRFRPRLVAVD